MAFSLSSVSFCPFELVLTFLLIKSLYYFFKIRKLSRYGRGQAKNAFITKKLSNYEQEEIHQEFASHSHVSTNGVLCIL